MTNDWRTFEGTALNIDFYRKVKEREMRGSMRVSKIESYENPCVKYDTYGYRTGLKKAPKVICKARIIGTWKAKNVEI